MANKILLVEDDRLLLHILTDKFRAAHIEVVTANDGVDALHTLENTQVDLVVLDLLMPHMDGYAFLTLLKKMPKWQHIPVLVSSNLGQEEEISRAMNLGATDYVVKASIEVKQLVQKVLIMLGEVNA